jgi:hypothetical protein
LIDDLPLPNTLRQSGFLVIHRLLLKAMKFPGSGRRERTRAQLGVATIPQIQSMLSRYVVYGHNVEPQGGPVDGALLRGDSRGVTLGSAFDITNENLVAGRVRLVAESPLIEGLNETHLDEVLHRLFPQRSSSADVGSSAPHGEVLKKQQRSFGCPSLVGGRTARGQEQMGRLPNVTFCVVVRNRAKLTLEWILYHKMLGVDRFIVLDDGSTDGLRVLLEPLVVRGIVEMVDADDGSGIYRFRHNRIVRGPLLAGYGKCVDMELRRAVRDQHTTAPWIGLLDSDEFLVLPTGECVPELLGRVLSRSPSGGDRRLVGAIAFSWRSIAPLNNDIFDTSPTQFHRTGFSRGTSDRIQRVKVIVDASLAESMDTAHRVSLRSGAMTIFPNGRSIPGPGWYTGANADTEAQGVIFHYHARSLVSWLQRYLDGFADNNNHQWPFDVNTYFGRWFADTAKTVVSADKLWLEAIPGWKERLAVVVALMTGKHPL